MRNYKIKFIFLLIILVFSCFGINIHANSIIKVDLEEVYWSSSVFIYDGTEKSIFLVGIDDILPEDVGIIYVNNSAVDCGIYKAKVKFTFDRDKYDLVNIHFSEEHSWSIRQPYVVDETESVRISSLNGIHPNHTLRYELLDMDEYYNVDCSVAGTYKEVKSAFSLRMMINTQPTQLDDTVLVEYYIPKEFIYVEDLQIYDFASKRLMTVESYREGDKLIFSTRYFSDTYLLIGMRNTYTNNNIWKGLLIFSIFALGIIGMVLGRIYRKRKKEKIAIEKEMYRRRFY